MARLSPASAGRVSSLAGRAARQVQVRTPDLYGGGSRSVRRLEHLETGVLPSLWSTRREASSLLREGGGGPDLGKVGPKATLSAETQANLENARLRSHVSAQGVSKFDQALQQRVACFVQPLRLRADQGRGFVPMPCSLDESKGRFLLSAAVGPAPRGGSFLIRHMAHGDAAPKLSVPSVSAAEAGQLVQAGSHAVIDVRTPKEFAEGHVSGAVNIPIMLPPPGADEASADPHSAALVKNEGFVGEVRKHLSAESNIILNCMYGKRGGMATAELVSAGFKNVSNLQGGLAAWEKEKLGVSTS